MFNICIIGVFVNRKAIIQEKKKSIYHFDEKKV